MRKTLVLVLLLAGIAPGALRAQADSIIPRVRGIAFDSIRNRPLADGMVAVRGGPWNARTDAKGRFELDSVPAGEHTIVFQHAFLDSIGFSGISARVRFSAKDEARIATPSFETLSRRACGSRPVSNDSGFVYGVIRDVGTSLPIANAVISVVWLDSVKRYDRPFKSLAQKDAETLAKTRKVNPPRRNEPLQSFGVAMQLERDDEADARLKVMRVQGMSDSTGVYRICGVPSRGVNARVIVAVDTMESDSIDAGLELRVHRRDIRVPLTPVRLGTVIGQLTDRAGNHVPYARVAILGAGESRSDDSGRFVLRHVDPGTRTVEARFIGSKPARTTVDVTAGDTTSAMIVLERVPMLGAMSVKAAGLGRILAAEFDSRRRLGLGHIVDSTTITRYTSVEGVLRDIPGLAIRREGIVVNFSISDGRGGTCEPTIYLDGMEAAVGHLLDLTTQEAVAIEAYLHPLTVPGPFIQKGTEKKCGAIVAWTKYAFRNR